VTNGAAVALHTLGASVVDARKELNMRPLLTVVWCFGLVLALAPGAAFASAAKDHKQSEVVNAEAQLVLAQQQATDFANAAAQEGVNAREIAFLRSESMRQLQLNNAANAQALDQIATSLAAAIRSQGDMNARNEMAILQIKADALIVKADAKLANALAIGRTDEITNAQAQSDVLHQLADFLTGTVAQQNMNNDQLIADAAATSMENAVAAEVQNDEALGANELFAADTVLEAANLSVESAVIQGEARGEALVAHAEANLANAEEMEAEAQ
jgi:hypothetical protein